MSDFLPSTTTANAAIPERVKPSLFRQGTLNALGDMKHGHLRLELPGGEVHDFGEHAAALKLRLPLNIPAAAHIRVRREVFFRKCVLAGDIGFAESFIDGDWETPNLTAVISWFILNLDQAPTLSGSKKTLSFFLNGLRFANRVGYVLRPNSRDSARRNIREHYDLSNDFFALFLDPSMMYSAAKWSQPDLTLEQAQWEKNDALCRKLRLSPNDHVLEVGTGWGGWSLQAAQTYGCRVTTVTISREQHELARQRIARAGLADRVDVQLRDYRDITGQFDKIVSIEMLEAVGHKYLPEYCHTLDRVLKKDGLLALQFITCPDARYEEFKRGVDFIQKHIFPGSLLLSLNRVNEMLATHGRFSLHAMDDFGPDYARTLRLWDQNFKTRLEQVQALGFDDRFIRKWTYYLNYCEAAFAMRNISVVQTLHTRANNLSL